MGQSCPDTVVACPLVPNSWRPLGSMEQILLKCQTSALGHNLCKCNCVPSAQALLEFKSSGDHNAPQSQASADQNVPQHQNGAFEVGKRFMETVVFTKTPLQIFSNHKHLIIEDASNCAAEGPNCQRALAGTPVVIPSVCQLPSSSTHKIDLQT